MATTVKQNGTAKKENASVKKEVQKKLTDEAIGKAASTEKAVASKKATISLDDRIQNFEKLRGLATQRERLNQTLSELTKFNYNQGIQLHFTSGIPTIWNLKRPIRTLSNWLQLTYSPLWRNENPKLRNRL